MSPAKFKESKVYKNLTGSEATEEEESHTVGDEDIGLTPGEMEKSPAKEDLEGKGSYGTI